MLRFSAPAALAAAFTCLALSSCAGMEQDYRNRVCSTEAGYETGTNDAQAGKPMDSNFAGVCDPQTQAAVRNSYRQGYENTANRIRLDAGNDGVEINGPGIDIHMGNHGSRQWACAIHIFGRTYSGFGASRMEAAQDARNHCQADQNPMHCEEMDCERAR